MKSIFKKQIIKSVLLDRTGSIVECEDTEKEFNELKSNYIFTSTNGNKLYQYHIVKHTWRSSLCNKLNIRKFDKTTYTIITNILYNNEYIKFETQFLICIDKQIDLQIALIDKINNSGEINYEFST